MRILGIDCGSERTGFGVIESDGRTHRLIAADVSRKKRAAVIDQHAAVFILQGALDRLSRLA